MASADRLLAVLGLFKSEQAEWTVEGAAQFLGLASSSTYRYFRALSDAGLIVNYAAGRYVLGPAIIEYDHVTRQRDPLIVTARPVMKRLAGEAGVPTVLLLCRLYRDRIMCVHQEIGRDPDFALFFERGNPMPLFRGATSRAVVANLPTTFVRQCFARYADEAARRMLGADWATARRNLREMRRAGVCFSDSELEPNLLGIAAPVFGPDGQTVGSFGLVARSYEVDRQTMEDLGRRIRAAAAEVTNLLSARADPRPATAESDKPGEIAA